MLQGVLRGLVTCGFSDASVGETTSNYTWRATNRRYDAASRRFVACCCERIACAAREWARQVILCRPLNVVFHFANGGSRSEFRMVESMWPIKSGAPIEGQLFSEMTIVWGLDANSGLSRLQPIIKFSPCANAISQKSY